MIWESREEGAPAADVALRKGLRESCVQLLALLAERDARRQFCPTGLWLVDELRYSELHRELREGRPRARLLLNSLPWALPFERRVNIFRELVAQEKAFLVIITYSRCLMSTWSKFIRHIGK